MKRLILFCLPLLILLLAACAAEPAAEQAADESDSPIVKVFHAPT